MDRKSLEKRLDQIAVQWVQTKREGNEALRQSLYAEIFELSFRLNDKSGEMWVLDAFLEATEKFEPEHGLFSHYLSHILHKRKIDAYRYAQRHCPVSSSLDNPCGEDGKGSMGGMIAGAEDPEPEHILQYEHPFIELTSMILNFAQCHHGKQANETRRSWYRIFYTEDMTLAIKHREFHFLHERDVFAAMSQSYLDYYMSAPCITIKQVQMTPLRLYCEVVPEREGENQETPLPIPGDVSLCYLRIKQGISVEMSARSNQKKYYKKEKELLCHC